MVFLCSCGGLIWENRVHVCGSVRCSCGAIKFNGRGHCCGYIPDYSVPPTDWELYSGYRSFDEWMGSKTWGKRSPSLFNTKNQENCILNNASSMEDIKNLQQTGSFQDYCKSFDLLLTRVILSEDYATNLFVEGLNSEIKCWVKFLRPKTLEEAYEKAKNQVNILAIFDYYKNWKKDGDRIFSNYEVSLDEPGNGVEVQEVIEIDECENGVEIQETSDVGVHEESGVEIQETSDVGIHEPMNVVYEDGMDIQETIDVGELKETVVDVKHSLDNKNEDVIDLEEGIKENVKEMFENVINDDVEVKKIEKESDDDVEEIEKEPIVDVKRFEWKPGWWCRSSEKLGIVQHRFYKHDVQVSIAWAFCNNETLITEFTDLNELIKVKPWLYSSKCVVKLDMLLGNCGKSELVALNLELAQASESVKVCLSKEVEREGCKGPITTFIVEPFVPHNKEYPEPIHKKVIFLFWPELKLKMGEDVEIVQHENALCSNLLLLLWKDRCTWHHKWKAKHTVENLDIHKATKLNHGMLHKAASGLGSKAAVAAKLGSRAAGAALIVLTAAATWSLFGFDTFG